MVAFPHRLALLGSLASFVFLGHSVSLQQDPTPVERVISLLGKLEAQITEEGKKEAAEYDKFACYCKDKADGTQYAIEKSEEKIKVLKAAIEKLEAEIKDLEADIKELTDTIKEKEEDIKSAEDKRKTEHEAYVKEAEEVAEAITAIEEAIEVLKDSKKEMKDAKLDLLQDKLLQALSLRGASPSELQIDAIQALTQAPASPAKKHAYEYQSNDIIATLEKLKAEFKENKKDINVAEKEKLFAFEEKKQALENEKAFAEKEKTEKESTVEDKKKDLAEKTKDKEAEEKDLKADQGFLDDLTTECQTKAEEWDQRSKVRSEELTAIGEAITHLREGVKPNYGSNQLAAGASFLQIRRGAGSSAVAVLGKAVDFLGTEASRLHSPMLSGLALKLKMKGGHFANVEKLIEDLIKKLEEEAKAEADSKTFCDEGMQKAVQKRDKNKLDMEEAEATIAIKKAEKAKLGGEIKQTSKEVAELQKALLEATELRSEEKAANEVTLEEAEAGKKAVDQAITVLQDFYSGQAFIQKGKGPNRDGDTVADTAPELSYSGDYKGKQDASKGIIGILEMIASDFEKTITETKSAESTAQSDFDTFETDTKDDIKEKTDLISDKEDEIKKADSDIVDAQDSLETGTKLLENAMEELEKLKAMCLTGEGSFAERKKQREEEIKALKGAKQILADWKDF